MENTKYPIPGISPCCVCEKPVLPEHLNGNYRLIPEAEADKLSDTISYGYALFKTGAVYCESCLSDATSDLEHRICDVESNIEGLKHRMARLRTWAEKARSELLDLGDFKKEAV